MQILTRYIVKNVTQATLLVFVVFTALIFVTGMLSEMRLVGEGDYGFLQVLIHELLNLPHQGYQFFPMVVLLGGVLGLGSLVSSNEIMVMRAYGVSMGKIIYSILLSALMMLAIAVVIGEALAPRTNYLAEKYKTLAQTKGQAAVTMTGLWIHEGNNFIHIDKVLGKHHLLGITRYQFDNGHHLLATYFAKSMDFYKGEWVAKDVNKTKLTKVNTYSQKLHSEVWDLKLTPNLLNVGLVETDAMSLKKLNDYSAYLSKNKLQASKFELAFWQRIFQPLTTLVMILLAVPFVFAAPRSSTMGKRILLAVMVGFVFYILNAFIGGFSLVYHLPPIIAALMPAILFTSLGFLWVLKTRVRFV